MAADDAPAGAARMIDVVDGLVGWLDATALTVAGARVTWAEAVGAVSGVVCVALVARQHVWNWPIGLVNNVMWAWLFFRARLYGDSALQGFFFALGCYGWWRWVTTDVRGERLHVRRTRAREWAALAGLVPATTVAMALFLDHATDSPVPLADATVVTLSLAATWAQAEKLLESWWLWIAVDVISVPLYVSRGLYPTAIVYTLFGGLCVVGLRGWTRALAAERAA